MPRRATLVTCPPRPKAATARLEHRSTTPWRRHVSTDTSLLTRLVGRHREKHRRYHTVAHVEAVVGAVIELDAQEPADDLGAVVAAAIYHDAVYEPASPANERASARLARRDLAHARLGPEPSRPCRAT